MEKFVKGYIGVTPTYVTGAGYSEDIWAMVKGKLDELWVLCGKAQSVQAVVDAIPEEKKPELTPMTLGGPVRDDGSVEVYTFTEEEKSLASLVDGREVRRTIKAVNRPPPFTAA